MGRSETKAPEHFKRTPARVDSQPRFAIAPSAGLRDIRYLEKFLDVDRVLSPAQAANQDLTGCCVLAWGRKPSASRARAYAESMGLRIVYLEDGWIRSSSDNAHSATCYSLLVDAHGVYYDPAVPSELERFLNRPDARFAADVGEDELDYARHCRQVIVDSHITKYNYCKEPVLPSNERPLILVIDQTRDDASVRCGAMDSEKFEQMLDAALDENPGARVVVRTHPDVIAGKRDGYLGEIAKSRGIEVSASADNPIPWLKRAKRVYVGTSQLGYEALMCECPVTVFGQPFYAGWGLSEDRNPLEHRVHNRTLDELFHATHVHLARYVSPLTGERWTLDQCLQHVNVQKAHFARNARNFLCVGMSPWKRGYIKRFLQSPDGGIRFGSADKLKNDESLVCWGFRCKIDSDQSLWRMEDGFLRSAGLGSDFTAPGSLVIDTSGLYFDPAAPSDLEKLLAEYNCNDIDRQRARRLRQSLLATGVSKYNTGVANAPVHDATDKERILVIGQVEDDESVQRGCSQVASNTELLQAVRKSRPDSWIAYRPHPDVVAGNRQGAVSESCLAACADLVDTNTRIGDSIDASAEIHTMTSLTGFEALMRDKKVVTWGAPFYSGWGLTDDQLPIARRQRNRSIDELVYICLIEYPRYVDPTSGEFADAETMVQIIERDRKAQSGQGGNISWINRQCRKASNVYKGLTYAP